MNSEIDPLIARVELISYLLKQYNLSDDSAGVVENDLQVLNTFALAKDWDKVKLALDKWTDKLKDAHQVAVIICKWNISIEVAIDGSDIEFLKLLLPFVGKHKKLRIKLSYMAIALEKQDQQVLENMLCHLHLDKDENSILARLPKEDQRAYQALFNRYCCVSDADIIKEILEDFKKSEVSKEEAAIIAQEHRLAMITYLCHHSDIKIAEDTVWNCINTGNIHISKLLETLKSISVIGWMETFDSRENSNSRMETGARPNTPLYHITNNKTPKTEAEDEQFNSLLALYSAYGGDISGIDLVTREKLLAMNPPESPRSLSGFYARKGAPKRFRTSSEVPSEAAVKIVQLKQDDYWTKYLCGEIQDISFLPWMEPSNDSKIKVDFSTSETSLPQYPENAIFEGLAGLASRQNSVPKQIEMKANYLLNFSFPQNPTESPKKKRQVNFQFDKNVFMNANFQWVMQDDKTAAALLSNPDAIVEWGQVALIITSITNCPICLTEPTVPKCTKCGHIYCWTCILQYLETNYKCPICFEYVASEDLRSVVGKSNVNYEQKSLTMKLLKRNSSSNRLALKNGQLYSGELPFFEDDEISRFSRHLIIKKETLLTLINKDKDTLSNASESLKMEQESWLEFQGYLPAGLSNDLPFIEIAIKKLEEKMEILKKKRSVDNQQRMVLLPDYYFFMDSRGEHTYLSHLDIKILKQEFCNYSEFPEDINVQILALSDLQLDGKLLDIDWDKTTLVTKETLNGFSKELSDRKRRILKMQKKESRESISLKVKLNLSEEAISDAPLPTPDDFPQGLIKPSSLDKEYNGPSFSSMTKKSPGTLPFSSSRNSKARLIVDDNENEHSDSYGWTLDLEDMLLEGENSKLDTNGKKKTKKISILNNGSSRRRI